MVVMNDDSSALTVQTEEPRVADADDAYLAGWIRGFAVAEAVQEPYEPPIVEPALKSES